MMLRLGVKFLGTIKNTPTFPFHLEDVNSNCITNHNNKMVVQCFGTRTYFVARTKIDSNALKAVVLRHGMSRVRAARLTTNMTLLLNWNTWVYETTNGTLGNREVKRLEYFENTMVDSSSDEACSGEDYVKLCWGKFKDTS